VDGGGGRQTCTKDASDRVRAAGWSFLREERFPEKGSAMRTPAKAPIKLGGVLPALFLFFSAFGDPGHEIIRQPDANLDSTVASMGELRAATLSHDGARSGRPPLATAWRQRNFLIVGSGLLAIAVTLLLILYQRGLAKRRRAERAARESEDRYRHLVEHSQGLICTHDLDGRLLSVNPAAARATGYTPEEMVGRNLSEFLVPAVQSLFDDYLEQIRQEHSASGVLRARSRDGHELIWAYQNVRYGEEGKAPYVLGHAVDITERVRAEQALKKERNFIEAVIETAGSLVVVLDPQGHIIRFNAACERLTGYSFDEVKGKPVWNLFLAPEEAKSFQAIFENLKSGEFPIQHENSWLTRRRRRRRIAWSNTALVNNKGLPKYIISTGIDITERRAAEEAVRESHRLFHSVIEGTPDGIFVKNPDGRYLMVNSACARFLNKRREEIIGKNDLELFPSETAHQFMEQDRRVLATGETQIFEGFAAGPSDTRMYIVTKGVYRDDEGKILGLIGISHDITERKRAEEQRVQLMREQQARREAETASRLKDEFLATVSHELRTPLTAILGWASILNSRELQTGAAKRALETIVRNARAQARLIEDILDTSRIATGKLSLELGRVELGPVIEAAVQAVRPAADAKHIQLDCSLDASIGPVSGDAVRLEQVVWNLLSNAVKFTPPGGRVNVRLVRVNSNARITVSDTGSGIRPEFLPFAFDRFRQGDSSSTREHGGLGLGLAIVRDLVEMHGGTIRAASRGEDQGATFAVELPLLQTDDDRRAAQRKRATAKSEALPSCSAALSGVRVLVVEDNADARELLALALKDAGAEVSSAASAGEAMETLQRLKPDVLLSDIQMPDEDGYTLIRKVRALGPNAGGQIRAAALSAYARSEDRARALRAGFQAYVAKPIQADELVAVVANLVGDQHRDAEPSRADL
jgi:PAS domain S-box-containing protein